MEDVEELQEEMIDRFGEYPEQVAYLFQIAKIKVHAIAERVTSIKQAKQEVTILLSEEASSTIDGQKIFKLGNTFGRGISLGMEGSKLKIVVQTKGIDVDNWLKIVHDMIKGLEGVKKENVSAV